MIFCYQLGMLPNGTWGFVSSSDPAGKNPNITQIRNSDFPQILTEDDVVMVDKGYQGSPFPVCIPFQQPRTRRGQPRQELTEDQQEYNRQLNVIRY